MDALLTSILSSAILGNTTNALGLGALGTHAATLSVDLSDLLTPVPVVPTREQLYAASIVSSIEPPADITCAICQDHEPPTDAGLQSGRSNGEWRILRHSSHRFHRSCIDQWFQQNVHCPVCRHDIRDLTGSSTSAEDSEND